MKLYYSATSPFARKIRIAAMILKVDSDLELVNTDVYVKSNYQQINPLSKIPSLVTRDGQVLTNSPFILEYLDYISLGKKILPPPGVERWPVLHFQSIADGIMEAAVLRRYESLRQPDRRDQSFENRQIEKIKNSLDFFESQLFKLKTEWGVAEISLACALGYLELRFASENWLKKYPRLEKWYASACELDAMKKTKA